LSEAVSPGCCETASSLGRRRDREIIARRKMYPDGNKKQPEASGQRSNVTKLHCAPP